MELKEAFLKRRSVRKFTKDVVSDDEIAYLLHAAMSGPSAMNNKPWEFYVITNKDKLEQLKTASQYTGYDAPLAIVVAGDLSRALPEPMKEFWVQDCCSATENILLAATDLGLGSVWCGIYPMDKAVNNVQKILGVTSDVLPLNIIYIGHPNVEVESRDQFDLRNVHFYN